MSRSTLSWLTCASNVSAATNRPAIVFQIRSSNVYIPTMTSHASAASRPRSARTACARRPGGVYAGVARSITSRQDRHVETRDEEAGGEEPHERDEPQPLLGDVPRCQRPAHAVRG